MLGPFFSKAQLLRTNARFHTAFRGRAVFIASHTNGAEVKPLQCSKTMGHTDMLNRVALFGRQHQHFSGLWCGAIDLK
jgi:hypothetical protein